MYQSITQEGTPINIQLLDRAVNDFFKSALDEQSRANLQNILVQFSERKDIYLLIPQIISSNCTIETKFMSINAFKNYVNSSWEIVPMENRQQLRQYVWGLLFAEKNDLPLNIKTKIIEIIIGISKYEYPQFWPTFIQQLLSESSNSLENTCTALKCIEIFSQEISDFAENSLTSARAAEMLNSFNQELQNVIELIRKSLTSNVDLLIQQALKTFCTLVKWIDPRFFFQTDLLNQLCSSFLNNKIYSSLTISILGEIVSMNYIPDEFYPNLGPIFATIVMKLKAIYDESSEDFFNDPMIISLLAITMTSFLSQYYEAVEKPEYSAPLITIHQWLIQLTSKDDGDEMPMNEKGPSEYIDSLITYWYELAQRIYSEFYNAQSAVRTFYEQFLPSIRRSLIIRVPPPYDFTDVEEEDGFRAHRVVFHTNFGDLYNCAKDALVLLTNLGSTDSVQALNEALQNVQQNGFNRLDMINKTGWAFSAIVGALSEQSDKMFVSNFISFYISLFNNSGNQQANHAISMTCCFMCSQAHKFLLRDNDLFVNIINWMLTLLQYPDEEVKAVAIRCLELFCKTNSDQMTSKQKITQQGQSGMSILEQILANFNTYYTSLSESSLYSLFSLTATLIRNVTSEEVKEQMFKIAVHFLDTPLQQMLPLQPKIDIKLWHGLTLLFQCNTALANSLGNFYIAFFLTKFERLMEAFTTLTSFLIQYQSQQGTDLNVIKAARTTSDAIILLLERAIYNCYDNKIVREKLYPICITGILQNFANTPPIAKSPKILKLFGTLAMKCQAEFSQNYRIIFDNIYTPVYQMIHSDFVSFENIRLDFFDFMLSLVRSCMNIIMSLSVQELNAFIEGIEFGMKHPQNDISEKSHLLLSEFINSVKLKLGENQEQLASFTNNYAVPLLIFTFQMMADTSHKSSFEFQVDIIKSILALPTIGQLGQMLFTNLSQLFNDQPPAVIQNLLVSLMNTINSPGRDFFNVLKDFLISVKHLLPQDPDLIAAQKKEAMEKTQQFFKSIEGARQSPLGGYPDQI